MPNNLSTYKLLTLIYLCQQHPSNQWPVPWFERMESINKAMSTQCHLCNTEHTFQTEFKNMLTAWGWFFTKYPIYKNGISLQLKNTGSFMRVFTVASSSTYESLSTLRLTSAQTRIQILLKTRKALQVISLLIHCLVSLAFHHDSRQTSQTSVNCFFYIVILYKVSLLRMSCNG